MKARRINFLVHFIMWSYALFFLLFIAVDVFGPDLFWGYFSELDFGFPAIVGEAQALRACGFSESARKFEYAANLAWLMFFILLPFLIWVTYLSRSFHDYSVVGRKWALLLYICFVFFWHFVIFYNTFSCVDGNLFRYGYQVGWFFYYLYLIVFCTFFFLSSIAPAYSCWLIAKAFGYSHEQQ